MFSLISFYFTYLFYLMYFIFLCKHHKYATNSINVVYRVVLCRQKKHSMNLHYFQESVKKNLKQIQPQCIAKIILYF